MEWIISTYHNNLPRWGGISVSCCTQQVVPEMFVKGRYHHKVSCNLFRKKYRLMRQKSGKKRKSLCFHAKLLEEQSCRTFTLVSSSLIWRGRRHFSAKYERTNSRMDTWKLVRGNGDNRSLPDNLVGIHHSLCYTFFVFLSRLILMLDYISVPVSCHLSLFE